ncbi:hypothetical protein [Saccharothrix hoggarensis]|uniref:Uncharacterized protein n=1 Tax=Saccharothrix hoggarensis TaxID=913853 RepID=A0ABW3QGT8_9PSEU
MYDANARLLWTSADWGGTFAANKTSGLINLREVADVWLAVAVTGAAGGTAPTLDVVLDLRDNAAPLPNWFLGALAVDPITAGASAKHTAGGLHIATKPLVLPEYGRIRATLGGTSPTFAGVTVSLFGR